VIDFSRRFYEEQVADLIRSRFPEYENQIAVGLAGEGSDCFGYDDYMSRDHDFGTGVCLWLTDEDMRKFGNLLSIAYNELAQRQPGFDLSERLQERRGVMTVHSFYSNILRIDCDTDNVRLSDDDWMRLDHACLATAVNGEVFRDDLGAFSAFRRLLLDYYPDRIWRIRIAEELHRFSAAMQVNYARSMTRGDTVAANLCRLQGVKSAMQLFFLMKREYPPYYKWTFRKMSSMEGSTAIAGLISELSDIGTDSSAWVGRPYNADHLNLNDRSIVIAEEIASRITSMMREQKLIDNTDPYLERYVNEVLP